MLRILSRGDLVHSPLKRVVLYSQPQCADIYMVSNDDGVLTRLDVMVMNIIFHHSVLPENVSGV